MGTRRSSRLANVKPPVIPRTVGPSDSKLSFTSSTPGSPTSDGFEPEVEADEDSYADAKLVKASRKRKVGNMRPRSKKKRGKLSALLELMPNEIFIHICSYLYPIDLLHVTQSSKMFALFLLSPSSSQIWHSARQELDPEMPARPDDLSEQQYCALIFGLHCHRCGVACRATTNSVIWMLRRRWCEKCRRDIVAGKDPSYTEYYFQWNIRGMVSWGALRYPRNFAQVAYKPELEAIQNLAGEGEVPDDVRYPYTKDVAARQEHAEMIETWMATYAEERSEASSDLRIQRVEDLKGFLAQEGYFRPLLDFIPYTEYAQLPSMKAAKRLSPRGWSQCKTKVLPLVDEAVECAKEKLIIIASRVVELEYEAYYTPFLPSKHFFPTKIHAIPQSKTTINTWVEGQHTMLNLIMQKTECGLPVPEEITSMFPYYVSENRKVLESFFAECLPFYDRLLPNKTPEAMLELAVSVFCSNYPSGKPSASERHANLPFHVAIRRQEALPYVDGYIDAASLDDRWSFDFVASKIICTIIRFIGLDADNCTHEQLEAADCFVSCLLCRDGRSCAAMHWEQAIHHWHEEHSNCAPSDAAWGVLTENERETVLIPWVLQCGLRRDFTLPNGDIVMESPSYDCALCPEAPTFSSFAGISDSLLDHLEDSHGIKGKAGYDPRYHIRSRSFEAKPTIPFIPSTY